MNRRMRSLHRSMGAAIALFVLLLSITGILLNHSSDLKLDKRYNVALAIRALWRE